MELPELAFERYECLEGTWTPMEAVGENHFVDTVRHIVYSPDIYGYTTQVLKTIRLAVPRVQFAPGPAEVIEVLSDSSAGGEEPDDMEEDPEEVPEEDIIIIGSSNDSGSDESVVIVSDPDL